MAQRRDPKVEVETVVFKGGLDQVSPALELSPGALIDAQNYEPYINGGYRRMYGIERLDGRPAPSAQSYYNMACALTGAVAVGNTVTGVTSGATAVVLKVNGTTELIVCKVVGTFQAETINVSGTAVGAITTVLQSAASTAILHSLYTSLAANNYRADIQKVPGSNATRGAWYYNGKYYAIRDNVGATAAAMFVSSAAVSEVVTISIAAPGVINWTAHGFAPGQAISFATTGALPTGLVAGTTYYVANAGIGANSFSVAATVGGAAITTSGTQSGTQTATSGAGWQQISFGTEILFGAATGQINIGDTVTGGTSGATGVVQRALLRTGTWTASGVGSLVFDSITGAFVSGEALKVGGVSMATSTTASTAIALKPGGRCEFVNTNFSGSAATYYMYFADGVNYISEFDGTRLVPIRTGINGDAPKYIASWRIMLVAGIDSSIEVSGIGQPYSWTALTGAAELALGAPCTGIKPQIGTVTAGTLTIFTQAQTFNLYGTSVADFNLVIQSPESGAVPYTCQNIGFAYYLDTKGVQQITTSQQFGGFIMATLTRAIQPIINSKQGLATATCVVKESNQYRVFFSDGTGIILYMQAKDAESIGGTILLGDEVGGISYFDYSIMGAGWYLNTVNSVIDVNGNEQLIAAGSDGYVYSLDKGTSFDGSFIESHIMLPFNSSKSPRNNKHYKRGTFHMTILGTANVTIGYTLNFGSPNVDEGFRNFQTLIGAGGIWDIMNSDNFTWDAQAVGEYVVDMPGDGDNLGILLYGDTDQDLPYVAQDVVMQYIIRRQKR
jgi:hypothetical protein